MNFNFSGNHKPSNSDRRVKCGKTEKFTNRALLSNPKRKRMLAPVSANVR